MWTCVYVCVYMCVYLLLILHFVSVLLIYYSPMYVMLVETKKKDDLGGSSSLRILGRTSAAAAAWIPRESTKFSSVVRRPIGGSPRCHFGYCPVPMPRRDHRCQLQSR